MDIGWIRLNRNQKNDEILLGHCSWIIQLMVLVQRRDLASYFRQQIRCVVDRVCIGGSYVQIIARAGPRHLLDFSGGCDGIRQ